MILAYLLGCLTGSCLILLISAFSKTLDPLCYGRNDVAEPVLASASTADETAFRNFSDEDFKILKRKIFLQKKFLIYFQGFMEMSRQEVVACLEDASGDEIANIYDIAFANTSSGYDSEGSGVIGRF